MKDNHIHLPIYFDNSATTKVDDRVLDVMLPYLKNDFGNPASRSHSFGWSAEKAVELARLQVAETVGCDPKEVVWTSGATESINLALKGVAHFYQEKGKHLITFQTEHKATLDSMRELERVGFEVTYLPVQNDGLIDLQLLQESIRPDTILVSALLVNNEIGVIQDIKEIAKICKQHDVLVHVDAAQAVGKMLFSFSDMDVDLMSLSAHKVYGPKGVGALCVRRKPRVRLAPLIHGGGQERGYRSGTLPTHQIVGMGAAFALAKQIFPSEIIRITHLRDKLLSGLEVIEEIYVNGSMQHRVPHNLNVSFNYVEGESLIMAIKDVAVSSGSACTSSSLEPSYVLRAIGRNDELAHSSIRFSIGRFNTEEEVDFVVDLLIKKIAKLRDISPLWEMYKQGVDLSKYEWGSHDDKRDVILL
jgi:cysteine desulfurase